MPILDEIEQWFAQRPNWQRKAYAALRGGRQLDDTFAAELSELCVKEAAKKGSQVASVPSSAVEAESTSNVRLLAVADVRNINRLAAAQKLVIEPLGVTCVYGDNGAGKTGYGRILRQVCQARGPSAVLRGNVFETAHGTPSAEVAYTVNDGPEARLRISGSAIPASPLRHFSIFDSGAASALVEQETDTAFRPFGLDLLDRFIATCDAVSGKLGIEIQKSAVPALRVEDFPDTTAAGKFVRQLHTPAGRKSLAIHVVALAENEEARKKSLGELVAQSKANDPRKLAQGATVKATRLQGFAERLERIALILTPERLAQFTALRVEAKKTADAAEVARTKAFSNEQLDGVGSDLWKRLWTAARNYAPFAQPDIPFAVADPQARCVLCAQPLDENAAKRMMTLEEFVRGTLETEAGTAQKRITAALDELDALRFHQPDDSTLLLELRGEDEAGAAQCKGFLQNAREMAADIRAHLETGEPALVKTAPASPVPALTALVSTLRQRALDFQAAATVTSLAANQSELAELEAKARLFALLEDVKREAARHERLALLEEARATTSTRAASSLSKELTGKYVSEALCDRFREEIKRLGMHYLEVELAPVGVRKGTLYHQIRLAAKQPAPLREIVSEGEFRALALAAFLAEVGGSASGILFDDPVSSLDHTWRERIAQRLAQEAKGRQVIVFTHDIVFHNLLRDWCGKPAIGVAFAERSIERRGGAGAGFCSDGPPWRAMRTGPRISALKQRLVVLKKSYKEGAATYELEVRDWYGCLREAWERAIEECLLNEAVVRYQGSISTNRLKVALAKIKPDDFPAIELGMSRASGEIRGHDDAEALNPQLPTPTDAEQDLAAFEKWVASKR